MKNNPEADSGKKQRSDNANVTTHTPNRILVGVLSILLLLFSSMGAIAVVTSIHISAARATFAANSATKYALVFDDKPSPSPTTTASPTSTPSPTPTTSATPSPTATSTPTSTPTKVTTPTPTPTKTAATPSPTSVATSTPSPVRSTPTAVASATPAATTTITALATQGSDQSQTPTTPSTSNTIQSASQDQQNPAFPFIALVIGVPVATGAITLFFIGWWFLRKRLLPVKKVKLPPSGAKPWSRVRASNAPWNMYNNGSTQPAGSNYQFSNDPAPWGQNSSAATGIPYNRNSAPPMNNGSPTPYGFGQSSTQNDIASSIQLPFNSVPQMHTTPAIPAPSNGANRYQADGYSVNSVERHTDAYNQWSHNKPEGTPDLNNPHLQAVIKQYSDKSRAARQQIPSNTSNEQAHPTQKDDTWLR